MKKANNKEKSSACCENKWQDVFDSFAQIAKKAKKKYDEVDPKTKKQIITAAASAVAAIALAIGLKKTMGRKK